MLDAALKRQKHLPRYLVHLYQRFHARKLNLVTGAGISIDAKVPSWFGLLDRLAESDPALKNDLGNHRSSGLSPEYLGQILYHRFSASYTFKTAGDLRPTELQTSWAQAIHDAIYKDVKDIDAVLKDHPYLRDLSILARKVPLVINFNFDDILSDAIGKLIEIDNTGRSLSVVWQPPLFDRETVTTVYHVNGILPRVSLKKRSPQLVFTEDAFAAALARSPGVSAEYVFLRFVQNTMLLLGLSLSDSSLKNYLRQNRDKSPANHNYMVHWIKDEAFLSEAQRGDIFQANLELYNLITIFLTSEEIKELVCALNFEARDFRDFLDTLEPDNRSRFHYYIVGPVAAGKSTILEHLRCFNTHEEWTRPALPEMYLAFSSLNADQLSKVDDFIYKELKEKNIRMQDAGIGFHFMDRAPLDLYAFSKDDDERRRKTKDLRTIVTRDKSLQPGEIIFIWAQGDVLVKRNLGRGRLPKDAGEADYLNKQTEDLKQIYAGAIEFRSDSCSGGEVAKLIARHILLEQYKPIDLMHIMAQHD